MTMKKRMLLALSLILCLAVLCACQSKSPYTVVEKGSPNPGSQPTQNLNMTGSQTIETDAPINFDDGSYDPTSEEGLGADIPDAPSMSPVPTIKGEYAGATPVVIDPIDKPTPTVVPPISFTYQAYSATQLHLAFEAPVGWQVDESEGTYVLFNPDPAMAYTASLTLTATNVSSQMTKKNLETQVESMLDSLKNGVDIKSFSPSRTASRNLMAQDGIYANYTAVLDNGEEIAGRVHATCLNKVLYTVHLTYPKAYRETYIDTVYDTLRKTMAVTQ